MRPYCLKGRKCIMVASLMNWLSWTSSTEVFACAAKNWGADMSVKVISMTDNYPLPIKGTYGFAAMTWTKTWVVPELEELPTLATTWANTWVVLKEVVFPTLEMICTKLCVVCDVVELPTEPMICTKAWVVESQGVPPLPAARQKANPCPGLAQASRL